MESAESREHLRARQRPGGALFLNRSLGGRQARNQHSKRAAADVIEFQAMTEVYALGFATMLATNAELDVRPGFLPRSRAISINLPTPARSIVAKGLFFVISSS
jgi:hypothetical protein